MRPLTGTDIADIIQRFLDGTSRDSWEWDDFISVPLADPVLETVRRRCAGLRDEFPPPTPDSYCGPEGRDVLRHLIARLRDKPLSRPHGG
jgi:hypothetical protein